MSRTIKEAEELTKVTSQNIRYYEKQGLLAPKREMCIRDRFITIVAGVLIGEWIARRIDRK